MLYRARSSFFLLRWGSREISKSCAPWCRNATAKVPPWTSSRSYWKTSATLDDRYRPGQRRSFGRVAIRKRGGRAGVGGRRTRRVDSAATGGSIGSKAGRCGFFRCVWISEPALELPRLCVMFACCSGSFGAWMGRKGHVNKRRRSWLLRRLFAGSGLVCCDMSRFATRTLCREIVLGLRTSGGASCRRSYTRMRFGGRVAGDTGVLVDGVCWKEQFGAGWWR